MDAAVCHRQKGVHDFRSYPRKATCQAIRLEDQDQPDGTVVERLAGSRCMAQHEMALQSAQLVVRNARLGELAEAGVETVDGFAARDDPLDRTSAFGELDPCLVREHDRERLAPQRTNAVKREPARVEEGGPVR